MGAAARARVQQRHGGEHQRGAGGQHRNSEKDQKSPKRIHVKRPFPIESPLLMIANRGGFCKNAGAPGGPLD